jgi:RNA polymerase sigma-70 factor (ECF subfamily)
MTDSPLAAARPLAPAIGPSFQEIFALHARFVWRALRYLGVPEADLEDVCQEVFLVVHRRLDEFEGRSTMRTWVYGIALRLASDHRKRLRLRQERASDPPGASAGLESCPVERAEARELLQKALDALDDDKRAILLLHEVEGFSIPEIADMLDVPVQTAYTRLHAARECVGRTLRRSQLERTP